MNIIDKEKISIIIPLYKSEAYIHKCVDLILNQTYYNIECILVDDGSPDRSGIIADEYAAKDKRVVVIHEKNSGTCMARNAGLTKVTGEYLMFADGDDWLAPDCMEYLLSLIHKTGAQMAMTDCVFTTRDMRQNENDWVKILIPEQATCEILYVRTPVGPWNKLYTTEIAKKNNLTFSVPWFGEGLWFSVMMAQYANSVAYGHRKVYIYRKNNPNSGTVIKKVQNGLNSLYNIKNIKKKLIVRTLATERAANWHIWQNNVNLLNYVISADEEEKYAKEFQQALHEMRTMSWKVLTESEIGLREKLRIIVYTLMPRIAIRRTLRKEKRMFMKDLQNEYRGRS